MNSNSSQSQSSEENISILPHTTNTLYTSSSGASNGGLLTATSTSSIPPSSSSSSSSTEFTVSSNLSQIKKRIDIEGWHIKADSCIYKGPHEHSSPIVCWPQDNVIDEQGQEYILSSTEILTLNGTLYVLGDIDPLLYPLIIRMYPSYDPYNPLRKGNESIMLLAEKFVYQKISKHVQLLGSILNELQSEVYSVVQGNIDIEDQITEQFNVIKDAFGSMGILVPSTDSEEKYN